MPKEEKVKAVEELYQALSRCSIGILTDYRGLTTAEMSALRNQLRGIGVKFGVVKNTLARLAAEKAGRSDIIPLFEGPVAIAFGYGEINEPAKVIANFIRSGKSSLSIKGGFLSDRVLSAGEIETLATLPSKEVLIAKAVGMMQSPIAALLATLAAPLRGLAGVLQGRINQLEGV